MCVSFAEYIFNKGEMFYKVSKKMRESGAHKTAFLDIFT